MFLRRKAVLLLDTTYVKIISKLVCGYRIPDTLETYGAKSGYRIPDTLKTYGANTEIRVYVLNPGFRLMTVITVISDPSKKGGADL